MVTKFYYESIAMDFLFKLLQLHFTTRQELFLRVRFKRKKKLKISCRQITNETLNRVNDVEYEVNSQCVMLPQPERFSTVEVFSLARGEVPII